MHFLFKVVKWQNACLNMHLAVKEIVLARKEGQLDKDTYTKMLQTACSKLCALPICIMTWFLSYKSSSLPLAGYVKVRHLKTAVISGSKIILRY